MCPLSQTLKVLKFLVMDLMIGLVDYVMLGCGKIGWPSKVNGFLMGFLKMNPYCTQLFYG